MLDEPPVLTIHRAIVRPDAAKIARLRGVQTSFVVDAMSGRGALDAAIMPLEGAPPPAGGVVGPALTCECGPADNLGLSAAVAHAEAGDVIVAATDGYRGAAVAGDLILGMAKNRGVAGFVTDGLVRDVAGILDMGPPTFCAGVTPNSPARTGPGSVGAPILVGGLPVNAGDVIVADADGVVVVPRRALDDVLARLETIKAAEAEADAAVRGGLKSPGYLDAILKSADTSYVD